METAATRADLEVMRQAMVASQLRTSAVNDPRLLAAFLTTPREDFLPEVMARLAYRDTALPLGNRRYANPPIATGKLLAEACIQSTDKVLLIGAAGGYTAALLGKLAASVVAVEEDLTLRSIARTALVAAENVTLVDAPLPQGAPQHAPYDLLVIDGAVEQLPDALVEQVAIGGRVVTGLVDRGVTRLASGRRSAGGFGLIDFADVECVGLPGFSRPAVFAF